MPLQLAAAHSTLAIRREAFERAGLTREVVDRTLNLTDDEFRVEGALITIGPLPSPDDVPALIDQFEEAGLVYFDDFIEIPGGFPEWIVLYRQARLIAARAQTPSHRAREPFGARLAAPHIRTHGTSARDRSSPSPCAPHMTTACGD